MTPTGKTSAIARALAAWGRVPDWVAALADACEASSQARAARHIGYSASVVNQVLGRTYRGDLGKVERAVRLAFLPEQVNCPVLGPITSAECAGYQSRPLRSNHLLAELAKTCPDCPMNEDKSDG